MRVKVWRHHVAVRHVAVSAALCPVTSTWVATTNLESTISHFRISEIDEFCAPLQLRTEVGWTPIRIDQTCIHFSLPLLSLTPLAHASSSYGVPRRW